MLIVKFILVFGVVFCCHGQESPEDRTVNSFLPLLNALLGMKNVHSSIKHRPGFEALDGIPKIMKILLSKSPAAKTNSTKVLMESWPLDYLWFTDSSISRIAKYLLTAVIMKKILVFLALSALMWIIPVFTTVVGDNANLHYFRHTDDAAEEEDEKEGDDGKGDDMKEAGNRVMYMRKRYGGELQMRKR
jgi:hypothetical protein